MSLDIFLPFLRWRTGKGFGVHSPWAFHFIREVLFQPCDYYAFALIDEMAEKNGLRADDLRLLYRLGLYFAPREISFFGENDSIRTVFSMARNAIMNFDMEKICIISSGTTQIDDETDVFILTDTKHTLSPLVNIARKFDRLGYGMIFRGKRITVAVKDKKLARQDFELNT